MLDRLYEEVFSMPRLLLLIVCLGCALPSYTDEHTQVVQETQEESLFYLGHGNASLLAHEPWQALEFFQKATVSLNASDCSSCVVQFLISFGQAVAFDTLGFDEQCRQSLGALLLAINDYETRNSDEEVDDIVVPLLDSEYAEAIDSLRALANMAASPDVRELLCAFVDEMSEELLPPFAIAKWPMSGTAEWTFDYDNEPSIQQCRSFWRKVKRFLREASEVLYYIAKGYKHIKEIKDTHKNWNN
jgi:hypothetical protein